ncbi:YheC/YheD family protein [Bacillus smithii]|uniref:YheC/YheD family endospore coat-associated protein n=1 Tax=Bacillus smithii TaxID=1479 RepID=UPI0030C9E0C9
MFFDLHVIIERWQDEKSVQISFFPTEALNINPLKLCVGHWKFDLKKQDMQQTNERWFQLKNDGKRDLFFLERKWQGYYAEDSATLFLGPVIAILTEIKNSKGNIRFPSIEEFCKEVDQIFQKKGGFMYVANLNDFYKKTGYYREEHEWKKETLPIPDVIYNRIHSRKKESSRAFRKAKRVVKKHCICFFNESFLDKWTVFQLLQESDDIRPYLPETKLLTKESLLKMLENSPVYIKPIAGSQGKDIIYAEQKDGKVFIRSTGEMLDMDETMEIQPFLTKLFHSLDPSSFLIQKKIDLLTPQDCLLDFRLLCHWQGDHGWKVTSIVARTGKNKAIVSNISQGGHLEKPKTILKKFFPTDFFHIYQTMIQLAVKVAQAVHQRSDGNFFELGVDIGIDQKGKIWLIEVNSKPSKKEAIHTNTFRPSALAIFHIAEKKWRERMEFDVQNRDERND